MINAININNLYVAMSNNSMYCDFFFFLGEKGSVKVSDSVRISLGKKSKIKNFCSAKDTVKRRKR